MNPKLTCDKCKRQIKLKEKHIKTVKVDDDIERMYFKCPHCNIKYTIAYADKEYKENIDKIKIITVRLQDTKLAEEEVKALVMEEKKLKTRSLEISQRYRKKYESKA